MAEKESAMKKRGEYAYVSIYLATQALQENLSLLDPVKHKAARNMNLALLHICEGMERLSGDLNLLHEKLQPILKQIADDQEDVRKMTRK
jgi:hypothetical protein